MQLWQIILGMTFSRQNHPAALPLLISLQIAPRTWRPAHRRAIAPSHCPGGSSRRGKNWRCRCGATRGPRHSPWRATMPRRSAPAPRRQCPPQRLDHRPVRQRKGRHVNRPRGTGNRRHVDGFQIFGRRIMHLRRAAGAGGEQSGKGENYPHDGIPGQAAKISAPRYHENSPLAKARSRTSKRRTHAG